MSDYTTERYMVLVGDRTGKDEGDETHELGAGANLANQVNTAMLDGWRPLGAPWGNEKRMWQAMMLVVNDEQPERP